LTDRIRSDVAESLKAGEKERVGALRVVLAELQKASKEGGDDAVTVLRRERKRRLDAAAQFRAGGRPELAEQEEYEAAMIAGYLPAELAEAELERLVIEAIAESGATSPGDMGRVMGAVMPKVAGRADGKRVSGKVREVLAG
jgi:uncharacterized protein YqeY